MTKEEIITKFWTTCTPSQIGMRCGLRAHEVVEIGKTLGLPGRGMGRRPRGWCGEVPRQLKPWPKDSPRFEDDPRVPRERILPLWGGYLHKTEEWRKE